MEMADELAFIKLIKCMRNQTFLIYIKISSFDARIA